MRCSCGCPAHPPASQELEAALASAREEAARLAREQAAAQAQAQARTAQAQAGGSLALAVATLPLLQLAYFSLRILTWLCAGLERLGLF